MGSPALSPTGGSYLSRSKCQLPFCIQIHGGRGGEGANGTFPNIISAVDRRLGSSSSHQPAELVAFLEKRQKEQCPDFFQGQSSEEMTALRPFHFKFKI